MTYFMMRPCRTTAAYVATLRKHLVLDLADARDALAREGYRITDCGVLLLIHDEPERTLYKTGRILVKGGEEPEARRAIEEIYDRLEITEKLAA
ncbi:MAG: hypothetical protein R3291_05855 [Thermoplasmata archaeon]|nr:hypothetical protein [Thermoplasmata archaeon]